MRSISGTITSGGNAQTLFNPQGQPYKGFWVKNMSAESIYINENGAAAASQPSMELKIGELYETPPNAPLFWETLSIFGATTGSAFSARVW